VPEKEETSHDVHQDDYCLDIEHVVHQGGVDEVAQPVQGGEATITEGNLEELIRNKKQSTISEENEDEEDDDTVLQYCSDGVNDNNDDMSLYDEDDDF
jgi:hypothetical protein